MDLFTYFLIQCIQLILASVIIYVYLKVKKFRKKPGDIFFMIAFIVLLNTIYHGVDILNQMYEFSP